MLSLPHRTWTYLRGTVTLPNIPYSGNGGCLFSYGGNIALVDCNASGNTATAEGGGIYSRNSNLYLANDTNSKILPQQEAAYQVTAVPWI